tara:strand:- start:71 stop:625 length:555 start_codon:yes stop_codon:yes gene_type:complete
MNLLKIYSTILVAFFFLSCSQPLDFEQVEEYTFMPSISSSLAFFSIDASNFNTIISGISVPTEVNETSDFKLLENSFIKQNLVKLDFHFEIRNEFNNVFLLDVNLLDAESNIIHKVFEGFEISSNTLEIREEVLRTIENFPEVVNFTKVQFIIGLKDTSITLNASSLSKIECKSSVVIHLESNI